MSTPESKVKDKVKRILQKYNAYYVMPHGAGYGNAGVPDFLVCYQGRFMGIECKANGGKPTALQLWNLSEIRRVGGRAMIIDGTNIEELHKEFR
jgi:hypothetical protein